MNGGEAASLTDALLVSKGDAAPSRGFAAWSTAGGSVRRMRRNDGTRRVGMRLDDVRYRRLRLAGVHMQKSAQEVLLAALDHYLERVVPGLVDDRCHCLQPTGSEDTACGAIVKLRTP